MRRAFRPAVGGDARACRAMRERAAMRLTPRGAGGPRKLPIRDPRCFRAAFAFPLRSRFKSPFTPDTLRATQGNAEHSAE